jgi:hypothetical protein
MRRRAAVASSRRCHQQPSPQQQCVQQQCEQQQCVQQQCEQQQCVQQQCVQLPSDAAVQGARRVIDK